MHKYFPKQLQIVDLSGSGCTDKVRLWIVEFIKELASSISDVFDDVDVTIVGRESLIFELVSCAFEGTYGKGIKYPGAYLAQALFYPEMGLDDSQVKDLCQSRLNYNIDNSQLRGLVILAPDRVQLEHLYGDAFQLDEDDECVFCVIKELTRKVVMHEVAHLFGAKDHYLHETKESCTDKENCLMQGDANNSNGKLCVQAIREIRRFV